MSEQEITAMFCEVLGHNVSSIAQLGSGRNSQVYRLDCSDGKSFAGKRYFHNPADPRDRMATEVTSLRFMAENGIACVPGVIAVDPDQHCAVYEYVNGRELTGREVSVAHVDELVRFLLQLQDLRSVPDATNLPPASDACRSPADILQGIQERLVPLRAVPNKGRVNIDLHTFLAKEFTPTFERLAQTQDTQDIVPSEQCVLSPSDFGFHNALEHPDGQIIFVDFEYFGWDDPAKMLSDFLLHPAVDIGHELRQRFLDGMLITMQPSEQLVKGLKATYPLHGLKWCLIFLNEFVPANLQRRKFASQEISDRDTTCAAQLDKARAMLAKIECEYESFPYAC